MARRTSRDVAIRRVKKRIVPVSEAQPYARVCLYGRHGKGKTRTACATELNTIVFDMNEEGTKSIQSYPGCYVYPIKSFEDMVWGYWYLREGRHDHQVLVLDTFTGAQKLTMRHVLNEAEDRDPNRPPNMPERRAWGQMTETLRPYIYDFRNLPMHVVFVCQERVDRGSDDEEESGEIRPRIVPDLSPGLRGDVMTAVDIIGRVFKRPVRRGKGKKERTIWETRMLVGDHEDYETKDRSGQLGYIVRRPTMDQMIEAANHIEHEEEEE